MDRLTLNDGDDIVVSVMSKNIELVKTDRGLKPTLTVIRDGQEFQWFIPPAAYKILKPLAAPDAWMYKRLRIRKYKEGNITRVIPSLVTEGAPMGIAPTSVSPGEPPPIQTGESVLRVLGETVAIKEQPYGITLSRGMKGQYGYELKVAGHTVSETIEKLYELTKAVETYIAALSAPVVAEDEGDGT